MATDEEAEALISTNPEMVAAHALVSVGILQAMKVELHRQGQHAAAAMMATYIGDFQMHEVGAMNLVARSVIEASRTYRYQPSGAPN